MYTNWYLSYTLRCHSHSTSHMHIGTWTLTVYHTKRRNQTYQSHMDHVLSLFTLWRDKSPAPHCLLLTDGFELRLYSSTVCFSFIRIPAFTTGAKWTAGILLGITVNRWFHWCYVFYVEHNIETALPIDEFIVHHGIPLWRLSQEMSEMRWATLMVEQKTLVGSPNNLLIQRTIFLLWPYSIGVVSVHFLQLFISYWVC